MGDGRLHCYWHGTSGTCSLPLLKHYWEHYQVVRGQTYIIVEYVHPHITLLFPYCTLHFSLSHHSLPPQCSVKALFPSSYVLCEHALYISITVTTLLSATIVISVGHMKRQSLPVIHLCMKYLWTATLVTLWRSWALRVACLWLVNMLITAVLPVMIACRRSGRDQLIMKM